MQKDVSLTIGFLFASASLAWCSQILAVRAEEHRPESEAPSLMLQVGHGDTEGLAQGHTAWLSGPKDSLEKPR